MILDFLVKNVLSLKKIKNNQHQSSMCNAWQDREKRKSKFSQRRNKLRFSDCQIFFSSCLCVWVFTTFQNIWNDFALCLTLKPMCLHQRCPNQSWPVMTFDLPWGEKNSLGKKKKKQTKHAIEVDMCQYSVTQFIAKIYNAPCCYRGHLYTQNNVKR